MTPSSQKSQMPFAWLCLLGLLTAIGPLAIDMYLPAFPAIAEALATHPSNVERTLASYLLGIAVAQLVYGPLADRFGRRVPLLVGLALFTVASLACVTSSDIHHLTLWRVVQAFGGAAGMAIPRAMIRDYYDTQDSAKALSLLMLIMGATPILAPTIGAQMLRIMPWESLFICMAMVGAALFTVTFLKLKESLHVEHRIPLRPSNILRNYQALFKSRSFLLFSLAGAFGSAGMFAYIAGSARVFIDVFGLNPSYFGLLFGVNAAALIVASQFGARLLNRYRPQQLLFIAQFAQVGFTALAVLLTFTGLLSIYSLMFCLMGFMACQGFVSPNSAALALSEQGQRLGIASALLGALQMLCGAIAGFAVSAWSANTALPLTTVLCACALLSWLSGRIAR